MAPGVSSGSVAVDGTESGVGAGMSATYYAQSSESGFGGALSADVSGYSSAADSDPIFWLEAGGRYRHFLTADSEAIRWFAAGGLGAGWAGGVIDELVVAGYAEIGVQVRMDIGIRFELSLRERPALFIGDGDPATELHNTAQVALTIAVDLGSVPLFKR